jgi:hypothetical protein
MASNPTYVFQLTVTNGALSWATVPPTPSAQYIVNTPCNFQIKTEGTTATLAPNGFEFFEMSTESPFSTPVYNSNNTVISFADDDTVLGGFQFRAWVNYNGGQTLVSSVNSAIYNEQ